MVADENQICQITGNFIYIYNNILFSFIYIVLQLNIAQSTPLLSENRKY